MYVFVKGIFIIDRRKKHTPDHELEFDNRRNTPAEIFTEKDVFEEYKDMFCKKILMNE